MFIAHFLTILTVNLLVDGGVRVDAGVTRVVVFGAVVTNVMFYVGYCTGFFQELKVHDFTGTLIFSKVNKNIVLLGLTRCCLFCKKL